MRELVCGGFIGSFRILLIYQWSNAIKKRRKRDGGRGIRDLAHRSIKKQVVAMFGFGIVCSARKNAGYRKIDGNSVNFIKSDSNTQTNANKQLPHLPWQEAIRFLAVADAQSGREEGNRGKSASCRGILAGLSILE